MLKKIEHIAVDDWVVLDSMLTSRFCGMPWRVAGVSGSRIYLESYGFAPVTRERELQEERFVARKSIRLVFTTEDAAQAASLKARELSEQCEAALRAEENAHQQRVADYLASLETCPELVAAL